MLTNGKSLYTVTGFQFGRNHGLCLSPGWKHSLAIHRKSLSEITSLQLSSSSIAMESAEVVKQ